MDQIRLLGELAGNWKEETVRRIVELPSDPCSLEKGIQKPIQCVIEN
jgi:hypothetical protein